MACVVQYLSAKLGLVIGLSLPEVLRDRMPRSGRLAYWGQAELVAMATDLAEVLGGAIALNILFDLPLLLGGVITWGGVDRVVGGAEPPRSAILRARCHHRVARSHRHRFRRRLVRVPRRRCTGHPRRAATGLRRAPAVCCLAAGMLGATVMPHAVYLHSALARDRHGSGRPQPRQRTLLAATRHDVAAAMLLAGAVNLAMLLLAAPVPCRAPTPADHTAEAPMTRSVVSLGGARRAAVRCGAAGLRRGLDRCGLLRRGRGDGRPAQAPGAIAAAPGR